MYEGICYIYGGVLRAYDKPGMIIVANMDGVVCDFLYFESNTDKIHNFSGVAKVLPNSSMEMDLVDLVTRVLEVEKTISLPNQVHQEHHARAIAGSEYTCFPSPAMQDSQAKENAAMHIDEANDGGIATRHMLIISKDTTTKFGR